MGWCHAFGPQIREGCDHAMVAERDRCTCAECGAACYGLFPGCASVWAAGPRRVAITKPGREVGNLLPATSPVVPAEATAPTPASSLPGSAVDGSELRALRVDMQVLMWKFDQLQQAPAPVDLIVQAAKQMQAATEALPRQLQEAVAVALETQRHTTRKMLTEMSQKIFADIGQLRSSLRDESRTAAGSSSDPSAGAPAASVKDLDSRFQWLVDAVSDRFITLGNEIARMERLLEVLEVAGPAAGTNGMTGHLSAGNGTGSNRSNGGAATGNGSLDGRNGHAVGRDPDRADPVAILGDESRP